MNLLAVFHLDSIGTYLLLMLGGAVLALALRLALVRLLGHSWESEIVDPYDLAYLAAGVRRTRQCAIAKLVHEGKVILTEDKVSTCGKPAPSHPLDTELIGELSVSFVAPISAVDSLRRRPSRAIEQIRQRLTSAGLLHTRRQSAVIRTIPASIMLVVFAIGLVNADLLELPGQSQSHDDVVLPPYAWVGAAAIGFLFWPTRTVTAKALLEKRRKEHLGIKTTAESDVERLTGAELAMVIALYGPDVNLTAESPVARLQKCWSGRSIDSVSNVSSTGAWSCGACANNGHCGGGH